MFWREGWTATVLMMSAPTKNSPYPTNAIQSFVLSGGCREPAGAESWGQIRWTAP
jgi:hypothetical protein